MLPPLSRLDRLTPYRCNRKGLIYTEHDRMKKTPQEKAENLINYFDGKTYPGQIRLNAHTVINDTKRMIEVNAERLRHNKYPSQTFVAAYYNLYELKKYLENGTKF